MGFSHVIHFRRPVSRSFHLHKPVFVNQLIVKSFSSTTPNSDKTNPKPTSLSARMSFVFDQIDAIEKERSQKDETLQRIRAWRESKKEKTNTIGHEGTVKSTDDVAVSGVKEKGLLSKGVELVHPWPEWIELMERLVQQNYFDCRRKDEDKLISDSGFVDVSGGGIMAEVAEEGFDFTRDWKTVLTAGLNFGKDRFDILRSLSKKDMQLLVGYGCPTADKKVVFSAKLLRKHVHLDEGDICSSCSLRNSCERAYLLTNKDDEARTIDIMRILMTYGFDPINGSVINDSLLKKKSVKNAVRKLLHEVVKLSAIPIDPNLPPPIIRRPPPKIKQTPPPPRKRVGRDDVEMKKGDWLCPKCDFMNFAKNTVCLQCDAKRPKRQLLPGEWECPECQFLNYRRNMACFHCECKRPPDDFTENQMREREYGQRTRMDGVPSRKEVSDAWNLDFDENESDGAEVAAFEYADSRKLDDDLPTTEQKGQNQETGFGDTRSQVGFDDFDDEEDDDVNSYELDTNNRVANSSVNLSDLEPEDDYAENTKNRNGCYSSGRNKRDGRKWKSAYYSDNDGVDLPVHPNWKSSHVANSRGRDSGRIRGAPSTSNEDSDLSSSDDDFSPNQDDFLYEANRRSSQKGSRKFDAHRKEGHNYSRSRGPSTTTSSLDHERYSRPRVNVR